ncbi:hypothetical protein [Planctomycetes bacterium Poly30]
MNALALALALVPQSVVQVLPTPPGPGAGYFGTGVSLDGHQLAITATTRHAGHFGPGRVHLYDLGPNGWSLSASLAQGFGSSSSGYASAVHLRGDQLIVGDFQASQNTGVVEIFDRVGGAWQPTLLLNDGLVGDDHFGCALDRDGSVLAVGARLEGSLAYRQGAVHVYENTATGWASVDVLHPTQAPTRAFFGFDVAVRGDRIAASGPGYYIFASSFGIAQTFRRGAAGGWALEHDLTPPDGTYGSFGVSIELDDQFAYVGSARKQEPGRARGTVDVFDLATGQHVERLTAPVESQSNGFGIHISVDGDLLVAGGLDPWAPSGGGRVSAFERTSQGWTWIQSISEADGLGTAIDLENGLVVIGDAQFASAGPSQAHVALMGPAIQSACAGAQGQPLVATGALSPTWSQLELEATSLSPSAFCFLVAGSPSANLPTVYGPLCIGGTIRRLGVLQADVAGAVSTSLNGSEPGLIGFQPGDSIGFQLLQRAPTGAILGPAVVATRYL